MENDWAVLFERAGAYWLHDGNPLRPYVKLTTPHEDDRPCYSNGYFNGHKVQEDAPLFGQACQALFSRATPFNFPHRRFGDPPAYVIGAEKGGTALAERIAEFARMKCAYAEKVGDELSFERFTFPPYTPFVLVEDTVMKGGTLVKLMRAARRASPNCSFARGILAECNRSGRRAIDEPEINEPIPIIALVEPRMLEWPEGENPFTPDGQELVPPVSGKTHWAELTRRYD